MAEVWLSSGPIDKVDNMYVHTAPGLKIPLVGSTSIEADAASTMPTWYHPTIDIVRLNPVNSTRLGVEVIQGKL